MERTRFQCTKPWQYLMIMLKLNTFHLSMLIIQGNKHVMCGIFDFFTWDIYDKYIININEISHSL